MEDIQYFNSNNNQKHLFDTENKSKTTFLKKKTHSRPVGDMFNKQGTLLMRRVLGSHKKRRLQNLKNLYRGLTGISYYTVQTVSTAHCSCEWKSSIYGNMSRVCVLRIRVGWGASDCPGPPRRWAGGNVLSVTFTNTAPWDTNSDNFTCPASLQGALSGQQGVRLSWSWLVWCLSGCMGDRYHNNIGTCKRKHTWR